MCLFSVDYSISDFLNAFGIVDSVFFGFFVCLSGYAGIGVISNAYWFGVVSLGSCVFMSSAFILGIVIRPFLFIFV